MERFSGCDRVVGREVDVVVRWTCSERELSKWLSGAESLVQMPREGKIKVAGGSEKRRVQGD